MAKKANAITIMEPGEALPAARQSMALSPMDILHTAVSGGADIATVQHLMDLSDRWEATQARKAFNNAIADLRAELRPIIKKSKVDFTFNNKRTNYDYEDLATIAEFVDPLLSKHGLNYRFRLEQPPGLVTVICIISHRDGYYEENPLSAKADSGAGKNDIQAVGSTVSYLERYTLKAALGLSAAKDDDGRGRGTPDQQQPPEPDQPAQGDDPVLVSAEQIKEIEALIVKAGADRVAFLEYIDATDVPAIQAQYFPNVTALLFKAIKKRAAEPPEPTPPEPETPAADKKAIHDAGATATYQRAAAQTTTKQPEKAQSQPAVTKSPAIAVEAPSEFVNPEVIGQEFKDALATARSIEDVQEHFDDICSPVWDRLYAPDKDWLENMRAQRERELTGDAVPE